MQFLRCWKAERRRILHRCMSHVTARQFRELMSKFQFPADSSFAVAVSGGPDSLALCMLGKNHACLNPQHLFFMCLCLVHEWLGSPPRLMALTVDHKLRRESGKEAEDVRLQLTAAGEPVSAALFSPSQTREET